MQITDINKPFVELFSLQDAHERVCGFDIVQRCVSCPTLEVTRPQRGLQQLCSRQICTNFHGEWDKPGSMRAVIDPGPILRRRENFRNWFSALRCILLTNNCGQSFSHPHNQDLKSAIKPKRAAFCTGTHFRRSCGRIRKMFPVCVV